MQQRVGRGHRMSASCSVGSRPRALSTRERARDTRCGGGRRAALVARACDQRAQPRPIELADTRRRARRARRGSSSSRSRQRSSACWRAVSMSWPCAHRSSAAPDRRRDRLSRISLPMYCSCRLRRAPRGDAARRGDGIDEPLRQLELGGELGEPSGRARPALRPGPAARASRACAGSSTAAVVRRSVGRAVGPRGAAVLQFVGPGHRSGGNRAGMGVRRRGGSGALL